MEFLLITPKCSRLTCNMRNFVEYIISIRNFRLCVFLLIGLISPVCINGKVAAGLILPDTIGAPGYEIVKSFPSLEPRHILQLLTAPGDDRYLFAVERWGRLLRIHLDDPSSIEYAIDIEAVVGDSSEERGFVSAAFHPSFPEEPYLYMYYTTFDNTVQGDGGYMRLSRVTVNPEDMTFDMSTEVIYIHQFDPSGEHQGGTICFGPKDGYLYLGFGDGGKAAGARENTQQIDQNFFAAVIRIDVDERPENLLPNPHPASFGNYRIPNDNPFVGATSFNGNAVDPKQVRTEFWAVGFRNPFRMRFDPESGELWLGDVGWSSWEELNRVEKGKNYGWPYLEGEAGGFLPQNKPTDFESEPPIWMYDHEVGNAIIVGRKYDGAKFPELFGKIILLDFIRGIVWAFDPENPDEAPIEVARHRIGLTDAMTDPRDGGILFCGQNNRDFETLERLEGSGGQPPQMLSDIGAFDDSRFPDMVPSEGVFAYEINVPFWSDYATKTRYVALPEGGTISYSNESNWEFPTGTVWVKHFELDMDRGDPSSRRNLETRFLVKTEKGSYGLSYRWNEDQTDAELVSEEGMLETYQIVNNDGESVEQKWSYPSQANCLVCHTEHGGHALAFRTGQLNRIGEGAWSETNQIDAMRELAFFENETNIPAVRPAMARADDESASLTHRVRSYLQANCAQCHQPGGDVLGEWDGRLSTITRAANLIHATPVGSGENPGDKLVVPHSPESSILFQRINEGEGRMPPLASFELDQSAIELMRKWINEEASDILSYEEWAGIYFDERDEDRSGPDKDPDQDGLSNFDEFTIRTSPIDSNSAWGLEVRSNENSIVLRYRNPPNRALILEVRQEDQDRWISLKKSDGIAWEEYPAEERTVELELPVTNGAGAILYRLRAMEP